ncbi:MAG: prolyl oligopeptidase family serine peptidase [Clostridia bacterium]|nr:prolyl oligopeptidase family serine peptidase [Clostridia bacterium]
MNTLMIEKSYSGEYGSMPYRLYLPADYSAEKSYPLILFLHGAGERGNDNTAQLKNAIGQMFADPASPVYQCIVVAPQCPQDQKWVNVEAWTDCQYSIDEIPESDALKTVRGILSEVQTEYGVDLDRVYATGLSMGGYGTWDLLVRHGELFAAAIPVCGGCDTSKAALLTDIPIYTFHGLKDPTVPCTGTEAMVDAIRSLGGTKITYVPYPEMEHNVWETAFATEGLYDWLLAQKRSDRDQDLNTGESVPEETKPTDVKNLLKWLIPLGAVTIAVVAITVGTVVLRKRHKQ